MATTRNSSAVQAGLSALLCASLLAACGQAGQATAPGSASAGPVGAVTAPPTRQPTATTSAAPIATPTQAGFPLIGPVTMKLAKGTYQLDLRKAPTVAPGPETWLQLLTITVPDGWNSVGGWLLHRGDLDNPTVAVQFWRVREVYRHPCQWNGTLFDPGPSVEDLAEALRGVPLRHASRPVDVQLDGYNGQYLEWSVPADFNFATCDLDGEYHDFESWTGPNDESDRYQQGPGQIDRLWILDIHGERLVIDAFSMPIATDAEVAELKGVVEAIHFELRP